MVWLCAGGLLSAPAWARGAEGEHVNLGAELPLVSVLPFVLLLAAIAILPLLAGHWWEHNRSKAIVSFTLAMAIAAYFLSWGEAGHHQLIHKGVEYFQFMCLLGALFVIAGGIYVQGSLSGTPIVNTAFLAIGGLLASFIGTTGASMVLIRPLLRANASRQSKAHIVVFFIFVVSNCGGLLTPLGDPPLFLGYLVGVPFTWTFQLWREWLLVNGLLLVIFHVWDQVVLNREELARPGSQLEQVMQHEPLRIIGVHNIFFLAGVVLTVYAAGGGLGGPPWPFGIQESILVGLSLASYFVTSQTIRSRNRFTFAPILEVAILFAGIFVTMAPALLILNYQGPSLGLTEPWQFFWVTGLLSSVLDNAPTYLTFAAMAAGIENIPLEGAYLQALLKQAENGAAILAAISCGAVFMGANTYIGNGPNFMVKAIAEENGVDMPGFFAYMGYALLVLIPIFGVVTLLFFL